jgi:hypothetical protein
MRNAMTGADVANQAPRARIPPPEIHDLRHDSATAWIELGLVHPQSAVDGKKGLLWCFGRSQKVHECDIRGDPGPHRLQQVLRKPH